MFPPASRRKFLRDVSFPTITWRELGAKDQYPDPCFGAWTVKVLEIGVQQHGAGYCSVAPKANKLSDAEIYFNL